MKKKIKDFLIRFIKEFKKYRSTNILFVSFVLLSLLIGIIVRLETVGQVFSLKPFLSDLTIILIIGSLGYLIKPTRQFIYYLIIICFFTFLGVGNTIYYQFYNSFLSVNLLATVSMLGEVDDSILPKLHIYQFVYLLAPIALIIINKKLYKRKYYVEISKTEKGKQMFLRTLVTGIVILFSIAATLTPIDMSRIVKQWNREYIVQRFGIYIYTFNDLIQSIQPKVASLFGYDKAVKIYREFYSEKMNEKKETNKYTNIFKGKNVIFVHCESIQSFLIDLEINDKEVTPNLNRLSKEGMYFSKFYPQISVGTSSDTEFTLLTGLMPSSSGTVFVSFFDRTFEGMPQFFNDLGYYTFSMHANQADYWNRKVMHKKLGYQDFFAKGTYIETEEEIYGLGLSDKSFFSQIVPIIKDIKETKSPFMSTIITLTNHSPYEDKTHGYYSDIDLTMLYEEIDEEGNKVPKVANYLEGTYIGAYIKAAHYADEALGELMKDLEENGILENTIVILYGDHEAKLGKKEMNRLYNYDPYTDKTLDKEDPMYISLDNYAYDLLKNTPFIIWSNEKKYKKEITDVMGMYDVLPTIANMFGFKTTYELGHDIFSNNEKIVVFPDGNFLTNKVYYNAVKEDYISFTNDPIDVDYIERLREYSERRLEVSNAIVVFDLINKIGKNFNQEDNKEKTFTQE